MWLSLQLGGVACRPSLLRLTFQPPNAAEKRACEARHATLLREGGLGQAGVVKTQHRTRWPLQAVAVILGLTHAVGDDGGGSRRDAGHCWPTPQRRSAQQHSVRALAAARAESRRGLASTGKGHERERGRGRGSRTSERKSERKAKGQRPTAPA